MAVTIDGTNGITNVNGSATTPAETGTDTDTGIYYGTNTVSLATGGTQRFTIDSSGNVGIGTSAPSNRLHVKQSADNSAAGFGARIERSGNDSILLIGYRDNTDTWQYNATYTSTGAFKPLTFHTSDAERMRIDTSGQVGVGFTPLSGQGPLQVYRGISGGGPATFGTTDANQVLAVNASSVQLGYGAYANGDGWIQQRSNGNYATNYALILQPNGGYVGIGTASPANKFTVVGGRSDLAAASETYALGVRYSSSAGIYYIGATNSSTPDLVFSQVGGSERMRIANDGKVTIASDTLYITNIPTTATAGNCLISDGEGNKFYRSTSSIKYKRNVVDMQRGLADVQKLRPVNFNGVSDFDGDKLFAGFIAEEIEALGMKEFVIYNGKNEPDGLQYANMVALLTKAIQELKAEFDAYKAAHP